MDEALVEYRRQFALLLNFLRCVAKKYYDLSVSWYPQVADTLSDLFRLIYYIFAYFYDLIIIIKLRMVLI